MRFINGQQEVRRRLGAFMRIFLFTIVAVIALLAALLAASPILLKAGGLHPDYSGPSYSLPGRRALIVTTSHAVLNKPGETQGAETGVFASEMSIPYYDFLDAGMAVDIASIAGGKIPIDPQSYYFMLISDADKRSRKDEDFQRKITQSLKVVDVDFTQYDIIFFAGGWGAAYDFANSEVLGRKISEAYYNSSAIIGGVCHGPLGLIPAKAENGEPLIAGRRMTGVTDRQISQLGITFTPFHPEKALREAGVVFESQTKFIDALATHVVVDDEERFVTGQNQNSGHVTAHEMMRLLSE